MLPALGSGGLPVTARSPACRGGRLLLATVVALYVAPCAASAQTFLDMFFDDSPAAIPLWEGPPPPAWQAPIPQLGDLPLWQVPLVDPSGVVVAPVAFPDGGPAVGPTVSLANAATLWPLWQNRPLGDFLMERVQEGSVSLYGGVGRGDWEFTYGFLHAEWTSPLLGASGGLPPGVYDSWMEGAFHNSFVRTPHLPTLFLALERDGSMWQGALGEAVVLPRRDEADSLLGPGTVWLHLWASPNGTVRALVSDADGTRLAALEVDPATGAWVGEPRGIEVLPGLWDGGGASDRAAMPVEGSEPRSPFPSAVRARGSSMFPVWASDTQVVWEAPFRSKPKNPKVSRFWFLDTHEGWVVEIDTKAWAAAYGEGRPDPATIPRRTATP